MKPVELETRRLRVRPFADSDLENCVRFRREVFAIDEAPATAANWLRWTIDSYRELAALGQPPYADYAVDLKATGECIGAVGIVPSMVAWGPLRGEAADRRLRPEVGLFWGILPGRRRRGYASEAAQALQAYLFAELQLRQVVATTERDNIASQGVMRRLGMRLLLNPAPEPRWLQVVGLKRNPLAS